MVFRAILGLCISGLYMVIESWLNGASTRRNRGTVFSAYTAIHLGAVTAGQYLILIDTPGGSTLFSVATILFALAVIPVCLSRAPSPPLPIRARPDLRKLWRNSQVAVIGCLTNGMANGAVWSLAPLYAKSLDLSLTGIALFVSIAILGGTFVQYPLGRLSDRLPDRRWLIAALCAIAAGAGCCCCSEPRCPSRWPMRPISCSAPRRSRSTGFPSPMPTTMPTRGTSWRSAPVCW